MKKICQILFMGILLLGFNSRVLASTVTWKDITNQWDTMNDENHVITSADNSLQVKLVNNDIEYLTNFKYENNIVSLVIRDKTGLNDEQITMNALYDDLMVINMIMIVSRLNTVDYSSLEEDKFEQYGITYESTRVSYESTQEGVTVSGSADDITKFLIDLDKFEEGTKSLRGTYDENKKIEFVEDPTVSLTLGKANSTSLELIVNVNDLSDSSTANCEIYLMPAENTTGESKVIGTINNCINGENKYTVSDLSPNTEYTFQVVLNETTSLELPNMVVGEKYVTFSTTSSDSNNATDTNIDNKENTESNITNPATGGTYIYIIICCATISLFSFIMMGKNLKKVNK